MPLNAFIIRPFGEKEVVLAGQDERLPSGEVVRRSPVARIDFDKIHRELIAPALQRLKIAASTTEIVVSAGNIREDMFHLLMTADLVVADVTLHNPNVFYELGIRHAFRDKFTFVIRSSVNDYPFDLKTDRYYEYNHLKPSASVDGLADAIRATLNSERADSPVFRLLPKMHLEDRSRFISVPSDFLEEVERARKHKRGGDLRLLVTECEGFLWEVEGLRAVGRAQFELNYMGGARATWEQILQRYPEDVEANMILSTVYQRMNDCTRSEQALARLSRMEIGDSNISAQVRSLIGRNLKAAWMASFRSADELKPEERQKLALRSPLLRKSIDAYSESFRENLNYGYSGLNALTLQIIEVSLGKRFPEVWKLLAERGDKSSDLMKRRMDEIERLAGALDFAIDCQRKSLASRNEVDFWFEIMEAAFLCLTSSSPQRVGQAFLEAMLWAPRYAEASMRRALEMYQLLDVSHPDPAIDVQANAREALAVIRREEEKRKRGNIVLFVGLRVAPSANSQDRVDPSDGPVRFLRPEMEGKARAAIRQVLERESTERGRFLFGMAAMANGTDILFHEVCDEMDISTRVYLALPKDQYLGEYVTPAGAEWVDRFNEIYRKRRVADERQLDGPSLETELTVNVLADSPEMPRWLQSKESYTVGKRTSSWMLQHALVQRYLHEDQGAELTMIALWDRRGDASNGGICKLVERAERSGVKVLHIDCRPWFQAETPARLDTLSEAIGKESRPFLKTAAV